MIKKSIFIFVGLIIEFIILFKFTDSQIEENIFVFDGFIFKNDTVLLNSFYISQGPTTFLTGGEYRVRLLAKNYSIIFEGLFDVKFIAYPDAPLEGELKIKYMEFNQSRIHLRLPYYADAEYLEILHYSNKIFFLNIPNKICIPDKICPEYCRIRNIDPDCVKSICGNRICEPGETQENCCKDCGCPSGYNCIENKCVKVLSPIVYFIILLVISGLIVIIILLSKRKSSS